MRGLLLTLLLWWGAPFAGAARAAVEVPSVDTPLRTRVRHARDAALVIGNEAYEALPQATYATADAHAFRQWLLRTAGVSKRRVLYLENASRDAILAEVRRLRWRLPRHGTVWIFFSGHGAVDADGRRVLLGTGAQPADPAASGVALEEIAAPLLRRKRADRIVFVIDAGFGDVGRDGLPLVPGREVRVPEGFPDLGDRVVVWAASRDDTPAPAFDLAHHGLFSWAVLGALRGWADGELDGERDGRVTFEEAQLYATRVARHVGYAVSPTREERAEHLGWTIIQAPDLEPGPGDERLSLLAREAVARRVAREEARARADARAFWEDTLALARAGGEDGRRALEAYIEEFSDVRLQLTWSVDIPEVREARRLLARFGEQGAEAADTGEVPLEPCDDLVALESEAILGRLSPGVVRCLEERVRTERLQTVRNRVSRLLIVNAEAAGDREEWERLVLRHLEEIDRSDPDLCFRYAIYLFENGEADDGEEVVRWADYALENKHVWKPPDYQKKVYALLRLRAEAAYRMWQAAEEAYAREPSKELAERARRTRGWTMDYAREWLDYARASGQRQDRANRLCLSAAGTQEFCREAAP